VSPAAEGNRWIVVDDGYRIVEVSLAGVPELADAVGQIAWALFPNARPVFLPYLEEAWHSRDAVLFVQFYKGAAVRVEAVSEEGRLRISWRVLGVVDVSTIDALQNSLLGIVEVLDQERPPARASLRPTLRIVEGGR
jgi:hypothetical protein